MSGDLAILHLQSAISDRIGALALG